MLLIGLVVYLTTIIPSCLAKPVAPRVPDLYVQVSQDLPVLGGRELEEIKRTVLKIPEINATLEDLDSSVEDISTSDFAASSNDIDDDWKALGSSKFRRGGDDEELSRIHQATHLPPFAFSEDRVESVDSDVGRPAGLIQQSWALQTTTKAPELTSTRMVAAFVKPPRSAFDAKLDLRRPSSRGGESKQRTFSTTVKASRHDQIQIRATTQILDLLGDRIATVDQAVLSKKSPKVAVLANVYNRGVRRLQWGSSRRGRLGRHRKIVRESGVPTRGSYMTKAIGRSSSLKGRRRRKEKNFAEALLESEEESFRQLKSTLRQIRDVVKLKSVETTTPTSSSFGGSFDFV